jgi:hypothetical protein
MRDRHIEVGAWRSNGSVVHATTRRRDGNEWPGTALGDGIATAPDDERPFRPARAPRRRGVLALVPGIMVLAGAILVGIWGDRVLGLGLACLAGLVLLAGRTAWKSRAGADGTGPKALGRHAQRRLR